MCDISLKLNNIEQKMLPLTIGEFESQNNSKVCYVCREKFHKEDKIYIKVQDRCHFTGKHRGAAQCMCNLRYSVSKETPIILHNGCIYSLYLMVNHLSEKKNQLFRSKYSKVFSFSVELKKTKVRIVTKT